MNFARENGIHRNKCTATKELDNKPSQSLVKLLTRTTGTHRSRFLPARAIANVAKNQSVQKISDQLVSSENQEALIQQLRDLEIHKALQELFPQLAVNAFKIENIHPLRSSRRVAIAIEVTCGESSEPLKAIFVPRDCRLDKVYCDLSRSIELPSYGVVTTTDLLGERCGLQEYIPGETIAKIGQKHPVNLDTDLSYSLGSALPLSFVLGAPDFSPRNFIIKEDAGKKSIIKIDHENLMDCVNVTQSVGKGLFAHYELYGGELDFKSVEKGFVETYQQIASKKVHIINHVCKVSPRNAPMIYARLSSDPKYMFKLIDGYRIEALNNPVTRTTFYSIRALGL